MTNYEGIHITRIFFRFPKAAIIIASTLLGSMFLCAQTSQIQVKITDPSSFPGGVEGHSGTTTHNKNLNTIFRTYVVSAFQPAYSEIYKPDVPAQLFEKFKGYYRITVNLANVIELKNALQSCPSCGCSNVFIVSTSTPRHLLKF